MQIKENCTPIKTEMSDLWQVDDEVRATTHEQSGLISDNLKCYVRSGFTLLSEDTRSDNQRWFHNHTAWDVKHTHTESIQHVRSFSLFQNKLKCLEVEYVH